MHKKYNKINAPGFFFFVRVYTKQKINLTWPPIYFLHSIRYQGRN